MTHEEKFIPENESEAERQQRLAEEEQAKITESCLMLEKLREIGVTPETEMPLHFFYASQEVMNAKMLADELRKKGYEVKIEASWDVRLRYFIAGHTTNIRMDNESVAEWTLQMNQVGNRFDSTFTGWGAFPEV